MSNNNIVDSDRKKINWNEKRKKNSKNLKKLLSIILIIAVIVILIEIGILIFFKLIKIKKDNNNIELLEEPTIMPPPLNDTKYGIVINELELKQISVVQRIIEEIKINNNFYNE